MNIKVVGNSREVHFSETDIKKMLAQKVKEQLGRHVDPDTIMVTSDSGSISAVALAPL